MPLNLQPKFFPANGDLAACWILAAVETRHATRRSRSLGAVGRAVWTEDRDIADAATLAIARASGLDARRARAHGARAPDMSARYAALHARRRSTRSVFGAPTYVVEDELFWGQDRLDFLDRELAK